MTTALWTPHKGPQTRFLKLTVDEALYGGAAGGGKSDALLYGPLRYIGHPQTRVLFLRRTYPELREVMRRAEQAFPKIGGTWIASERMWKWPNGATYEFGYCETYADAQRYQGQEYTQIAWDELGQIPDERTYLFVVSRARTTAPNLPVLVRASANPGGAGHAWVKARFVDPCGITGGTARLGNRTVAFTPARVEDNPSVSQAYREYLDTLPEPLRSQLRYGDWTAGEGLALPTPVLVPAAAPEAIPTHWTWFGAFDWGYDHPFSFGLYVADGDGQVFGVDATAGRGLFPREIADRVRALLARWNRRFADLAYTVAGHDCWSDTKARGETGPTIQEQLWECGWPLEKAKLSRVAGLNNLRRYLDQRDGRTPKLRFYDTPGNRDVVATLARMVVDPRDREDALKVNANERGEHGDDAYDQVRYAMMSRPLGGQEPPKPQEPGRDHTDVAALFGAAFASDDESLLVGGVPI